ncbi:hypothetical protein CPARK_000035400 [cyanobacterium endosymbiont of Braarudosphaera bigelowii]|uniref:Tetratricopeptide repeat protein n=2 Tax=Candidatus Atelocyanobacterium thalassae TaxID=713887 RepID=A0ABM7U487_9CHRO|nr:hypothetical protein CPARK_000035400 [cyanobacterium endosymbiont of Braarudosphaera bigelowii]
MIYRFLILILTLLISIQSVAKASTNNMVNDTLPCTNEVSLTIATESLFSTPYSSTHLIVSNIFNNYYSGQSYIGSIFPAETQNKYQQAIVEYEKGNIESNQQQWDEALGHYKKAVQIYPNLIFARVNIPLIYYQNDHKLEAIKEMRYLLKKYPMSADIRAALTAILWSTGQKGEAKSHWVSVAGIDDRYKNLDWIQTKRFWPPKIIMALDDFFNSK